MTFAGAGVADRCRTRVGYVFAAAPEGADQSVIRDGDDGRCAMIPGHVRGVLPENRRLLVIEPVDGTVPDAFGCWRADPFGTRDVLAVTPG